MLFLARLNSWQSRMYLKRSEQRGISASRPLLDWPIAWFCASIPSQHHCSSLLSHSYWTGHRDWALGMRRNISYNMILCLYCLSTSLRSSLLSHSYWTGHENRALCIFPSPGSSILDRRQPIVEIVLLASLIQLSIQPLSVGSAKACATKAIWKAASKKIYTNNYFSGKWKLKAIANWMRTMMTRSNIMHRARKERLVGANKTMILCNSWRNWPPW